MFRQTHLVPSGAQTWIPQVVSARGSRFAYASTLAIYIYNNDDQSLSKIAACQTNTITAYAWHPKDDNLLAVCTNDNVVHLYNIAEDTEMKSLKFPKCGITALEWDPAKPGTLLCVLNLYVCDAASATLTKQLFSPGSRMTSFNRHPKVNNLCAIGTVKGEVWLYNCDSGAKEKLSTVFDSQIMDVGFDPKSEDYLLVATAGGRITLWGLKGMFGGNSKEKPSQIMEFTKQATGLSACKWVDSMPGTFVTASDRHGVIRVWNVSNQNPLHMIKTEHGAVSSVACLEQQSTKIAVSFKSGEVALVDLRERRTAWANEGGHTETIFDCSMSAADCNTLVSCSFDGTVRTWDMRSKECTAVFNSADAPTGALGGGGPAAVQRESGQGALYSCAMSCDGGLICAGGVEGKLYFFDVAAEHPLKPVEIAKDAIHRVVPHPLEAGVFAAVSLDGTATIATKNGMRLMMRHTGPVCGCAFDPFNPDLLATATKAGAIEVWDITTTDGKTTVARLEGGHSAKVYGVVYSPLLRGKVMSVSDDKTARVWTLNHDGSVTGEPAVVLSGHTSNVRAQAWHPEIAHVCFTGSWDKTIRTWDVRNGVCLHVNAGHLADVYSIATHPEKPFVAVTCSRDTTIRFWSTEEMCPSAKLRAVMGADVAGAATVGAGPAVGGAAAKLVGKTIGTAKDKDGALKTKMAAAGSTCEKNKTAFAALSGEIAAEELWHLAVIEAAGPAAARAHGDGGITVPHRCEVKTLVNGDATMLEAVRGRRVGSVGAGAKEVTLRKAASLHLQLGHVDSYCDIMKEIGDWDAALAAAPAVSLEFWRRLASERAAALAAAGGDLDGVVHLQLAAGQAAAAADALREAGRGDEAFTVACTAGDGGFDVPVSSTATAAAGARQPRNSAGPVGGGGGGGGHSRTSSHDMGNGAMTPPVKRSPSGDPLDSVPAMASALPPAGAGGAARTSLPKLEPLGSGKLAPLAPLAPLGAKPLLGALGSSNGLASMGPPKSPSGASLSDMVPPERGGTPPPSSAARVSRTSGSGSMMGAAAGAAGRGGDDEASAVRAAQAVSRLSHGDALGAASCYLSVGDAGAAVRTLVRGGQIEMAAALILSLPGAAAAGTGAGAGAGAGSASDAAHGLLAERAVSLGEWDLAREAASAIGDAAARAWRLRLVCARHSAVEGNSVVVENFKGKCLNGLSGGDGGGGGGDAADSALSKILAGEVDVAAAAAVSAVNAELKLAGPWNAALLTRLLAVLGEVSAGSNALKTIDPKVRAEVTLLRCYVSALAVASAGYTPVSHSLFHHARAALKQLTDSPGFPHPVAYVSLQDLSHMSATYPDEATQGLEEVAAAESVPAALRDIAKKIAGALAAESSGGKGVKKKETRAQPIAISVLPGYMGAVDFDGDMMEMKDALQAASFWNAAGFTDPGFFKPPQ